MSKLFIDMIREADAYRMREGGAYFAEPGERGYSPLSRKQTPEYRSHLLEAARLLERTVSGDRWAGLIFQEAMTTSDFPLLFGDVLERSVLSSYQEWPVSWPQYAKRGTINDFRQKHIFTINGASSILSGPIVTPTLGANVQPGGSGPYGIEQVSEYPERRLSEAMYTNQVFKYGARMPFAWETMINDDLDLLKDTPAIFGRAARRTEEYKVTQLFVSSTGPNATFFSAANKNRVVAADFSPSLITVTNPPLSITALQQAMLVMMSQVDTDGEPIVIESVVLVVPPALKVTAMNILNSTQVFMNDQGGTRIGTTPDITSGQRLLADNWARNVVSLAVNPYLPIINTTSGQTAWYLFANPNNGRPALEMDFLRGHESPEIFMKASNQTSVGGGGMTPPMGGDFDTDAIHYKVRHILGGTTIDPKMAVESNGTGS